MAPPLSELAVQCGGFTSKLPLGLLQCPWCRAALNYGQEGIRVIISQAKHLFVMAEKEDNE